MPAMNVVRVNELKYEIQYLCHEYGYTTDGILTLGVKQFDHIGRCTVAEVKAAIQAYKSEME